MSKKVLFLLFWVWLVFHFESWYGPVGFSFWELINGFWEHWVVHAVVPGLPVVGNLLQLKEKKPYKTFLRWAEIHGPIYSIRTGASTMVVLNSTHVAKEVLVLFFYRWFSYTSYYTRSVYINYFIYKHGLMSNALIKNCHQWVWENSYRLLFFTLSSSLRTSTPH